jgi:acylphosphatase
VAPKSDIHSLLLPHEGFIYLWSMKTVNLIISGDVQGVFFRARAKDIAEMYQVSGWIRNLHNGNVEACVTGTNDALGRFISWCRKGPEKARVQDVAITNAPLQTFERFEITR